MAKPKKVKVPTEEERLEAEAQHDAEVKTRTSRFDQDLKERARNLAINPDNFETEAELEQAVKRVERENRGQDE